MKKGSNPLPPEGAVKPNPPPAPPFNRHNTHHHFIDKCDCGSIINQCRCMATDKKQTIINNGCKQCIGEKKTAPVFGLDSTQLLFCPLCGCTEFDEFAGGLGQCPAIYCKNCPYGVEDSTMTL